MRTNNRTTNKNIGIKHLYNAIIKLSFKQKLSFIKNEKITKIGGETR